MDADATFTPLLCPKRFVGCGEFCISEDCANEANGVYGAYDGHGTCGEPGAHDEHGTCGEHNTYCANEANVECGAHDELVAYGDHGRDCSYEANGVSSAYVEHNENCTNVQIV